MVSINQILFTLAASTAVLAAPLKQEREVTAPVKQEREVTAPVKQEREVTAPVKQEREVQFSNFQSVGLAQPGEPAPGTKQAGSMTYYLPGQGVGNGYGACGSLVDFTQPIVAVSGFDYGVYANPNDAKICGHWIKITGRESQKSAWAQVVDKCPEAECPPGFIDVSEGVFKEIAGSTDAGRIQVDWEFVGGQGLSA